MDETGKKLSENSHLMLHRTGKKDIREGVTVMIKGGARVFDQDGNCYIDLDFGVTRLVHIYPSARLQE
jgi:glutamate-1-semialdehyde aminotransferase